MWIPGASRSSDEVVWKTSGRYAGGGHLTIEFSSDESGPENLCLTLASGGLHVARQQDMENVVSQEGHQQKAFDGVGIMLEHMIGVPFVGQLVEAIILDIPSLVPQMDVKTRNGLRPTNSPYEFSVDGADFSVVLVAADLLNSVTFTLAEHGILVRGGEGNQMFEVTLNFTPEGECKLIVNDRQRDFWQVRRMALEELLFHGN
jgi:hypothetical protein